MNNLNGFFKSKYQNEFYLIHENENIQVLLLNNFTAVSKNGAILASLEYLEPITSDEFNKALNEAFDRVNPEKMGYSFRVILPDALIDLGEDSKIEREAKLIDDRNIFQPHSANTL